MPPGFMPGAAAAEGPGFALVICTPEGPATLLVDAQGEPLSPEEDSEGDPAEHCVFAAAGAAGLAPPGLARLVGFSLPAAAPRPQPQQAEPGQAQGALGSRAPPARL